MTDYNDGKWHGWNGGKCPVHPKTEVDAVAMFRALGCEQFQYSSVRTSGDLDWSADTAYPIIAFRVTKEHREPREWWICAGRAFASLESAEAFQASGRLYDRIYQAREVLVE